MRNFIILLFATLLFTSCSNVAFKEPQPEFLEPLTEIPEKFHGVFVIPEMDSAKYIISNLMIAGDSINNGDFVIKSWGNYLFINEKQNSATYDLTIGKAVKFLNYETLSIHYMHLDSNQIQLFNIAATEKRGSGASSSNLYILENVNRNQFQNLLNTSSKKDVIRIE